ncbi:DNA polymerase III subunit gamma/tau [bacterium]|nr:DNA polymerase III subunit gamma/tau [bacterium]
MAENNDYQVLARRWRPQRFSEVVGQDHIVTTLQNAITQGRVGQGYLFIGTRGTGKTTIARILAKALNCLSDSKPVPEPCCQCASCQAIKDGTSLDVIEIDGASNRTIDNIRQIRDTVSIAPVSSRYKIYIIDEVHMLTKEAFNALLKTLEEPPAHVKFFFATTDPQKIPPTILSRVQKFELRRMDWATLNQYLSAMAAKEGLKASPSAIAAVARAGNGSMRDALSVFDQVLAWGGEEVTEKDVASLLGLTDREIIAELNEAIVRKDCAKALECVAKVMEGGRDAERFILSLVQYFRNLAVLKVTNSPGKLLEESPEYLAELGKAAAEHTMSQLTQSIDELLQILPKLSSTEAKQTILELAVLKLIHIRSQISPDEIFQRLAELEKGSVINEREKMAERNASANGSNDQNPDLSGDLALAKQLFPGSRLE